MVGQEREKIENRDGKSTDLSEKRKAKSFEQEEPDNKKKKGSMDVQENRQNERFNPNRFVRNSDSIQVEGTAYRYFVRPYVPFWSSQKLTFEEINKTTEIPSSRTMSSSCSKRYVLHHLVKTWHRDEPWFDKKEIFDLVQDDLALKLDSISYGYKKEIIRMCSLDHNDIYLTFFNYFLLNFQMDFFLTTAKSFRDTGIVEFGKHVDTVLDAWLLYQMKSFVNPSHSNKLTYFPSWNDSNDVSFS